MTGYFFRMIINLSITMRARLLDRLPYLANQTTPLFCVRVYLLAFLSSILLQLRWSRIEQALRLSLFPPRSSNLEINVALSCERSPANVAGSPVSLVSFNARGAYRTAKRCLLKRGLRVSQRWRKICGISIRICSCFFLQAQRSSAVMEASKTFVIRAAARVVHSTFWQGLQPPHPEEIGMPKFVRDLSKLMPRQACLTCQTQRTKTLTPGSLSFSGFVITRNFTQLSSFISKPFHIWNPRTSGV